MKKFVLWVASISVICLAIGIAIVSYDGDFKLQNKDIDISRTASIKNVSSIDISSSSADIKVEPTDGNEILIHYAGRMKSDGKNDADVVVTENGSNLTIKSGIPNNTKLGLVRMESFKLEIKIPASAWKEIKIKSATGNIELAAINSEKLSVETTSGNVIITNCLGSEEIKTASGDIKIIDLELKNNKNITSVSGTVNLFMPKTSSFNLMYNTMTGRVSNSFEMPLQQNDPRHITGTAGDGKYTIFVETATGDLIY